jgi:hypothetical protein
MRASDTSSAPRGTPSPAYGTLRYRAARPQTGDTRSFGAWLEPRYIVGAGQLLDQ